MKNFLFVFVLFAFIGASKAQSEIPSVKLVDINGGQVDASQLRNDGKPFAICFWAVWNKTSLLELNNLMEKYDKWHDTHKVKIYAICIDEHERIDRAKMYIDAHEWKYNVLFDEKNELEKKLNIRGVPHLMLLDANGKIVWQEHEYHSGLEDDFIAEIEKL